MIFVTLLVLPLPALAMHAQAVEQAGTFSTVLRCRETLNYLVSLPRRYRGERESMASHSLSTRSG